MLLPAIVLYLVANTFAGNYEVPNEFLDMDKLLEYAQSSAFASASSNSGQEECIEEARRCPEDKELGYSEAEFQFENLKRFLKKQQGFQKPTQQDRNYAALLSAMIGMGQAMTDGYSFEEAYAQWPGMVVLGREYPIQVREMVNLKLQDSTRKTQLVRDLLNQICGTEVSAACDCKIEDKIKNDPKLRGQGDLLIQVGYLSRAWYGHRYQWIDPAACNTIEDYLEEHKEDLRCTIELEKIVFTMKRNIDKGLL